MAPMNSSFRVAFWTLAIALALPLTVFVGVSIVPNENARTVAWHEQNPQWGLHRGEKGTDPATVEPSEDTAPASSNRSPVVLVADAEGDQTSEVTGAIAETRATPHTTLPAADPAEAANPPPQRRTHRAPVALTSKERTVPGRKKPSAVSQEPEATPALEISLPEEASPSAPVKPKSAPTASGPQLGDIDVSVEEENPQPAQRKPAAVSRGAEFRPGEKKQSDAAGSESTQQDKLQLESRLASLQQQLDQVIQLQLSQAREQHQLEQLQQAAQLVQQMQQKSSVDALERQVQGLQVAFDELRKGPTPPAVTPPAVTPPTPPANTISEPFSELPAAPQAPAAKTISKVYRPQYVSARDLQPLINPLLTPGTGRVSISDAKSADHAIDGGTSDSQSPREGLLVVDLPETIRQIDEAFAKMDVPPPQVDIEATIVSVQLTEAQRNGVNLGALCEGNPQAGYSSDKNCVTSPAREYGLRWDRYHGNSQQFLASLEQVGQTQLIAQPRVVISSRQQACLAIGGKPQYRMVSLGAATTGQNSDSGARLQVCPVVTPDGMIRLEIEPEGIAAALKAQSGNSRTDLSDIVTKMVVADGQTVVIGGLIEERTVEQPVSNRRKLLNVLSWRRKNQHGQEVLVQRNELILLLTPRIIRPSANKSVAEAELPDSAGDEIGRAMRRTAESGSSANVVPEKAKPRKSVLALLPAGLRGLKSGGKTSATASARPTLSRAPAGANLADTSTRVTLGASAELPFLDDETSATPPGSAKSSTAKVNSAGQVKTVVRDTIPEPVTILPPPAESASDDAEDVVSPPPPAAKPGVIPVSSKHPYGRVGLSLEGEESPGLYPPDSDDK